MENTDNNQTYSTTIRRWILRGLLFVYDAVIFNFSYFMAIILRFYIENVFYDKGADYMIMFRKMAPYYTAGALIIFILFRLYSGIWRYAGVNDARRVLFANICTCALQIVGSLIIIGRMPLSYYGLGAFIQLVLTSVPRLAPRYFIDSFNEIATGRRSNAMDVPLMIVGVSENARIIRNKIDSDKSNIVRPVCVADYENRFRGTTFNGLPIVSGREDIIAALDRYNIKCVILSDSNLSENVRTFLTEICQERNIELRDFIVGTENAGTARLIEEDEWVQRYREETGNDVSFF